MLTREDIVHAMNRYDEEDEIRLLNHDAEQRAEIKRLQAELIAWKHSAENADCLKEDIDRLTKEVTEQSTAKMAFFNGMNDMREQREALRRQVDTLQAEQNELKNDLKFKYDFDALERKYRDALWERNDLLRQLGETKADLAACQRDRDEWRQLYGTTRAALTDSSTKQEELLRQQLATATATIRRLEEALRELCDVQNGPPLEQTAVTWQVAMDKAHHALVRTKE